MNKSLLEFKKKIDSIRAKDPNAACLPSMEEQYKQANFNLDLLAVQMMHPEFFEQPEMLYVNIMVNGHPI